jgi:hypothetical protein
MTKFFGPKGMREIGVNTSKGERVLKAGKDGMFEVNNPKLAKKLREEGLGEATASGSYRQDVGYTCNKCGFGSFFKQCSKCGEING